MEQNPRTPERIPFPDFHGLRVSDLVVGGVLAAGRFLGRAAQQIHHEGLSDHFHHEEQLQTTRMAQIELNYDGNGSEVE